MNGLTEDERLAVLQQLGEALSEADRVRSGQREAYSVDNAEKRYAPGVLGYRAMTMKDAKRRAEMVARHIRVAIEIVDPSIATLEARRRNK